MRYLKVTLLLGSLVCLIVLGIFEAGGFASIDRFLAGYLGHDLPSHAAVRPLQYLLVTVFTLGIAWTSIDISSRLLKAVVAATAATQILTATALVHLFGRFFSPFPSLCAVTFSFAAGFAYSLTDAGGRKQILEQMFGDRVSRKLFGRLLDAPEAPKIFGLKQDATVLVCEIANRQMLMESMAPSQFVALHNAFLRNAADFLRENGAYLDECSGERIRVAFGTPFPERNHAQMACTAAIGLVERLNAVNQECAAIWHQTFDFRIGIDSGEVLAGSFGSETFGRFTLTGEPATFAQQLCQANLLYGSQLLISSTTFSQAEPAIEVRPMELIQRSPGDPGQEEVYELLSQHGQLTDEQAKRRDAFWTGILYCRQGLWNEATTHLNEARPAGGTDAAVEYFLRRVRSARNLGHLPTVTPASWISPS